MDVPLITRRFLRRLRRTLRMVRAYWSTVEGDWSAIAIVLRHEIREQRLHMLEHDITVNAEHYARQMLIAERALDRMIDSFEADPVEVARLQRMLFYLPHWWD